MSMTVMLLLRAAEILIIYMAVTVLLPYLCFRERLRAWPYSVRFMASLVIGNFYLITMVHILEFCHISYWPTLVLGTIAPCVFLFIKRNRGHVLETVTGWTTVTSRYVGGNVGGRTVRRNIGGSIKGFFGRVFSTIWKLIKQYPIDFVLTIGVIAAVFYIYGGNIALFYGYNASDLPVHNYWINSLGKNKIYVSGVYPFGFHCIVYYIHNVFRIPTYIILRVFGLTQTLILHFTILIFMRRLMKNAVISYLATAAFIFINIVKPDVYVRLYSTLPQEFGRIFILPAVYFLIRYFKWSSLEPKKDARRFLDRKTMQCLILFVLSFSLTISIHFYNTIVLILALAGVGIAHLPKLLRWKNLWRIVVSFLAAIVIGVLPMAASVAAGADLEGSLIWGLTVIKESVDTSGVEVKVEEEIADDGSIVHTGAEGKAYTYTYFDADGNEWQKSIFLAAGLSPEDIIVGPNGETLAELIEPKDKSRVEMAVETVKRTGYDILRKIKDKILQIPQVAERLWIGTKYALLWWLSSGSETYNYIFIFTAAIPVALGILFLFFRDREYADTLFSVSFTMVFLFLMCGGMNAGIPSLMDEERAASYVYQFLPLLFGFSLDGALHLFLRWFKSPKVAPTVSLIIAVLTAMAACVYGYVRTPAELGAMELNDAMVCMYNIMAESKKQTWMIVSAGDESHMIEDYGYHYETIQFLSDMEGYDKGTQVLLEVPEVYFFVEKTPVGEDEDGNGYTVGEQWAQLSLPKSVSSAAYVSGEPRNTVMSRMYYWAEKFMELYPNEMSRYYETDKFVCYHISQNVYSLYNFAIDYGYNN